MWSGVAFLDSYTISYKREKQGKKQNKRNVKSCEKHYGKEALAIEFIFMKQKVNV